MLYKNLDFNKEDLYAGFGAIFVSLSESNTAPARLIKKYGHVIKII
jgi:hypothetical protein